MCLTLLLVPKNYSYLLEERALPAVFECLSVFGEQCQSEVVVSGLLHSLGHCSSLPPVDWTGVLLNIVRRTPNMYQSCLQYALKLTNTSKGFHTFIVYCCSPMVLHGLEVREHIVVYAVVNISFQTAIQQMLMSKLHLLVHDMSSPSLGDLLASWSHVCQHKKVRNDRSTVTVIFCSCLGALRLICRGSSTSSTTSWDNKYKNNSIESLCVEYLLPSATVSSSSRVCHSSQDNVNWHHQVHTHYINRGSTRCCCHTGDWNAGKVFKIIHHI